MWYSCHCSRSTSRILPRCLEGIAAGSLIYAGEKAASLATVPAAGYYATLFMGMGSSMQENIIAGEGLFTGGSVYLGPLELAVGRPYLVRLLPGPVIATGLNLVQQNHFNYQASLWSGTLTFEAEGPQPLIDGFSSYTHFNVITMRKEVIPLGEETKYVAITNQDRQALTFAHENVHAAMYRWLGVTDGLFRKNDFYATATDTLHIALAADITLQTITTSTSRVPHDLRPHEYIPSLLGPEDLPAFTK